MQIDLKGKVAVVTGVGRGIGREIATTFAREGIITISIDINEQDLAETSAELAGIGGTHRQYVCDIRNRDRIAHVIALVDEEFGRLDVLVNNAGVSGNGPIDTLSEDTWDMVHNVNLNGTFLMCQAAIPMMKRQRSGRIINAASFAALVPIVGSSAYASSKIGVAHFTRALAGEVGPWNITANAYAPGMIPTSINHFSELPRQEQDRLLDTLTLRHWGAPSDIASLVCFLASDHASYITGTLIDISGGKLATQIPRLAYEATFASSDDDLATIA